MPFYEDHMEICVEGHSPKYKIIYKGAKDRDYQPEWLVCERCYEKRIFGTEADIVSIEPISE